MNRSIITLLLIFLVSYSFAQPQNISGYYSKNIENEFNTESAFDRNLNAYTIGETIKRLSSKPHNIGSPGGKENAEYILSLFKQWGWDAKIETFYVLFPTPVTRELDMTIPSSYKAMLKEPAIKEDPTTGQAGQLPTYNAYSSDGDVTGEVVFINYGLPEDYIILDKMGISVKGKIVIVKYGRIWRGIKPKLAQEHGAIGCLIYSDPADDGYFQGDVYPKGSFRNEYGVQRGSVLDFSSFPGDPLTPGAGATKDAKRLDRSEAPGLLKIPVLPISYHDAAPFLKALDGPVAPVSWHGGLPFAYHIGPGKATAHLKLSFNWDLVPCYDVIAMMHGSKFPDEWVIRGNHQDAWVNGATDPISGLAAELEEARSIGTLHANGWNPDRTLVYCAWDGEEPGLLGSTEWEEEHEQELREKAVIYINSDGNGRGFLYGEGSHALEPFLDEISKQVTDPQTGVSVFERRKAHNAIYAPNDEEKRKIWNQQALPLDALGSGSDYSSFIQHSGIPTLNIGFGGEDNAGEYHSIYDSYTLYEKFKDPGFKYGVALAEVVGHAVLRMGSADGLDFDFTSLQKTIDSYVNELITFVKNMRDGTELENMIIESGAYKTGEDPTKGFIAPGIKSEVPFLDFSPLQNALHQLEIGADKLDSDYNNKLQNGNFDDHYNQLLYKAEQQLLLADGLPRRSWYKHSIYAPGYYTGYGVKTLPGVREAIEQRNWNEAQEQIVKASEAIVRLAEYLNTITSTTVVNK